MNKTDAELRASASTKEGWATWGAIAVVIGLLLEIWLVIEFPQGKTWIENWAPVLADALIAGGVTAEIAFGRLASEATKELQKRTGNRLTEALDRASLAQRELTKYRTPRRDLITPEAIRLIKERLKPFAGTKYDIGHARIDREQWDFMWRLEPAIRDAGWKQIDWVGGWVFGKNNWPGNHVYGEMGVTDVSIEARPEFRDQLMPAAEALAAVLNEIGIKATTDDDNNSSLTNDAIHLIVGRKQ